MQRSICRIIRGTCRKFRENDCPTIATEELRQKKSKEEFIPPKYSITEALGWTTGLLLTYEFTHRQRRRQNCFGNAGDSKTLYLYIQNCPFAFAKRVAAQPTVSTVSNVRSPFIPSVPVKRSVALGPRKSIDTTPFLSEPEQFLLKDIKCPKRDAYDDSDDEEISFDPTISKYDEVRSTKPQNQRSSSLAEKLTSNLFSAVGAFKFLMISPTKENSSDSLAKDPEIPEAMDILEKGAQLGSSRALYNIGVAYNRMNEVSLSMEYFQRAADLGHPLASYNIAVMNLKEGNLRDGVSFMKYAAENGVQEAKEVISHF